MMKPIPFVTAAIYFLLCVYEASAVETLSLPKAIQEGIENSPYLKLREKNYDAASAKVQGAWSSFYPHARLETGRLRQSKDNYYTKLWRKKFNNTQNLAIQSINSRNEQDNLFWSVKGSLNLFRGFGNYHNLKEKKKSLEMAELESKIEKNDLIYDIVETYIDILNLQSSLSFLQKAKESANEQVSNFKKRYDIQLSPKSEWERAQERHLELDWKLTEAEQALEISYHRLNQLLGRETNSLFQTVPLHFKNELQIKDLTFYINQIQSNLSLRRIEAEIGKKKYKKKKLYSYHLLMPEVRFEADYEERARKISILQPGWRLGVVAKVPIFDGLKNFSDLNRAQASLSSSEIELRLKSQATEMDIKRNFFKWTALNKEIQYLNMKRRREQGLFDQTHISLKQKAATITQLHAAEVQVLETETELLNKKREQFLNTLSLEKLIGEIDHEQLIRTTFRY